MNNLYHELNLQATKKVYDDSEKQFKQAYQTQKSNQEELLTNIARVIITYTVAKEFMKISNNNKMNIQEKLFLLVSNSLKNEFKLEKKLMKQVLECATIESYNLDQYILSLGTQISINKLPSKKINEILLDVVKGENWNERLWKNKVALEKELKSNIKQFLNGQISVNKIERIIKDKYSQNAYNTYRLVQTEVARVQNVANEEFFKDQGIEKLMYLATLDRRTCSECAADDGLVFEINDTNRPLLPRHPLDRCCYTPIVENWQPLKRRDNEVIDKHIDFVKYNEWLEDNEL